MDDGTGYTILSPTATTNLGYNITGLTAGNSYYFKVAAINKHGVGPNTNSILVQMVVPPARMLSVGVS